METAPANVPLPFEVTFNSGLAVAMSVFDVTTGSAVLVSGPAAMIDLSGLNTYFGQFTAAVNKNYIVVKAVYTDGTFATLDTDYPQGSESFTTVSSGSSSSSSDCDLVGFIQGTNVVVGLIECTGGVVIGLIEC